jgi:hypothetical protein
MATGYRRTTAPIPQRAARNRIAAGIVGEERIQTVISRDVEKV